MLFGEVGCSNITFQNRLRTVFLCHLSHINNTPQLAFHCVRTALEEAGARGGYGFVLVFQCFADFICHYLSNSFEVAAETHAVGLQIAVAHFRKVLAHERGAIGKVARIASCEGHLDNAVTAAYLAGIVPAYRLRTVFLCHLAGLEGCYREVPDAEWKFLEYGLMVVLDAPR